MKKTLFALMAVCVISIAGCKNNDSKTTSTSATKVSKQVELTSYNAPVFETAVAYNDYIINRQKEVYGFIFKMSDASNTSPAAAEKVIDEALPAIDKILGEIKDMPPFKGDVAFRDAAVVLFSFYKTTFDKSYRAIMEINKKGAKKTAADIARMTQISNDITNNEAQLDITMKTNQKNFGVANGMMIQENTELQEKVNELGK